MDSTFAIPFAFLVVSALATLAVARALYRGSPAFLTGASRTDPPFGTALGGLLVVGFVLVNLGVIALQVRAGPMSADGAVMLEVVAQRVGVVLLVLGTTFFLHLLVLQGVRRSALEREAPPPVAPDRYVAVAQGGKGAS